MLERHNIIVNVSLLCRLHDLLVGSVGLTVNYVILNSSNEKEYVLLNYTDVSAKRIKSYITNIRAVNENSSAVLTLKLVEIGKKVAKSGFSSA